MNKATKQSSSDQRQASLLVLSLPRGVSLSLSTLHPPSRWVCVSLHLLTHMSRCCLAHSSSSSTVYRPSLSSRVRYFCLRTNACVDSSHVICLVRKKAPMVLCCLGAKYPSMNRSTRHVFPTPLSPRTTTCSRNIKHRTIYRPPHRVKQSQK